MRIKSISTGCPGKAARGLALLALLVAAGTIRADNYAVNWFKISGGGGVSSGGIFSVSGTIGQHDAGQMSGGGYSVSGGFWSVYAFAETAGGPVMSIKLSGGNAVLSWPASATGFALQQNADLTSPGNWTSVPQAPVLNNGVLSVTIPASSGNHFFRLKQ